MNIYAWHKYRRTHTLGYRSSDRREGYKLQSRGDEELQLVCGWMDVGGCGLLELL